MSLSTIKKFWKPKIKYYGNEVTDCYDKEVPKVDSSYTCLAVISLDSDLKKDKNYCPQVFLKESEHIEKNVFRHINDNWWLFLFWWVWCFW